jgi:hypothetical protein
MPTGEYQASVPKRTEMTITAVAISQEKCARVVIEIYTQI